MLVREQISTTPKNRMTLNSNPQKNRMPQNSNPKNRMNQDVMVVKVWINMKSYHDSVFQYCVFFIQWIQVCDTKIGRPKNIAGDLSGPKNSGNFAKPRKIAKNLPTQKNRIWPNFKPKKKIGRASLSKFWHVPPWDSCSGWRFHYIRCACWRIIVGGVPYVLSGSSLNFSWVNTQ